MRVLVTGHDGYIGSALVPIFQAAGHVVVGVDAYFFENGAIGPVQAPNQVLRRDIRDLEASDLQSIDAVVHLAAMSNDPLGNLNRQLTYDINHLASVHLGELAKQAGVRRFLYSSSCSTYGARRAQHQASVADDAYPPVATTSAGGCPAKSRPMARHELVRPTTVRQLRHGLAR